MSSIPCPSWRRSRVVLYALAILAPMLAMSLGTPVASATQSDEPITLNLWIFEGEEQLLPALEEAFEAEHPTIDLEVTLIPEDQYAVKIDTALAAGSPPDIGFLYEQRWVKAGQILPLDDMIAAQGIEMADFNQAVLDGWCLFEGHVYCIGSYIGATVLIYNKAMFDAAGLEYPSATEPLTIDEYAALAEQLTVPSDDVTQVVWGGTAEPPYWWLDPRGMFSEDGRQIEGYVNDDVTKHAYDVLSNMVIQGHAPSGSVLQTMGNAGSEDLIAQGKLAMEIGASSEFGELEAAGIDYGVAPIPVEQEGDPVHVSVWTDGFSVFNGSAHPEEAKAFLGFLATEGQRLRVEVTGEPPLSASAAAEYGWAEQGNVAGRQEFLQAIGAADPGIFIPSFFDVVLPLEDAFNLMVEGEATSAVLDEVAPRMQDSLDQNWETWEQFGG